MGVGALGIVNRGAVSEIAPNVGDHLECDECGMCIDICPVGALTSGIYRYKTRPWEMTHVGTICTHCGDGCKTTLGVRNDKIIRGNNRDRSGVNGEFLCVKGRYAFDFADHPDRLASPLMRIDGKLEPVSWSKALAEVAARFRETKERGGRFGVIGSNHTTNEENFYLRKFAREVLGTENIDHHRTGDIVSLGDAPLATSGDLYQTKAVLVIGADLALQHPFLSFQIRANVRHHRAHVYVVTPEPVREDQYATAIVRGLDYESLREKLAGESELVILYGDAIQGDAVRRLKDFAGSLGIPVKYVPLVDYSNSRGAVDMGLLPGPGGMSLEEMVAAGDLDVLWVIGANPLRRASLGARQAFAVVQDLFLTETAARADVVLPAACAYEKSGTVTNTCGEVQQLKRAVQFMGAKPDLEIIGLIAKEMGAARAMGPWLPDTVFEQIRKNVTGYSMPPATLALGAAAVGHVSAPVNGYGRVESAHDTLFTSGTLGRYSKILNSVLEKRNQPQEASR
jgi:NADH-quinone oxidoreductase subunit G